MKKVILGTTLMAALAVAIYSCKKETIQPTTSSKGTPATSMAVSPINGLLGSVGSEKNLPWNCTLTLSAGYNCGDDNGCDGWLPLNPVKRVNKVIIENVTLENAITNEVWYSIFRKTGESADGLTKYYAAAIQFKCNKRDTYYASKEFPDNTELVVVVSPTTDIRPDMSKAHFSTTVYGGGSEYMDWGNYGPIPNPFPSNSRYFRVVMADHKDDPCISVPDPGTILDDVLKPLNGIIGGGTGTGGGGGIIP